MNNTTNTVLAATAPLILGIQVNDIYLIGMLIISLIGLIPIIMNLISSIKSKDQQKVKENTKELQDKLKDLMEYSKEQENNKNTNEKDQ